MCEPYSTELTGPHLPLGQLSSSTSLITQGLAGQISTFFMISTHRWHGLPQTPVLQPGQPSSPVLSPRRYFAKKHLTQKSSLQDE